MASTDWLGFGKQLGPCADSAERMATHFFPVVDDDPLGLFTERFPRDPEQPLGAPCFMNGLWRRLVAEAGILPLCPLDPNAPPGSFRTAGTYSRVRS